MRDVSYVWIILLLVLIVGLFSYSQGSLSSDDLTGEAIARSRQQIKVGQSLADATSSARMADKGILIRETQTQRGKEKRSDKKGSRSYASSLSPELISLSKRVLYYDMVIGDVIPIVSNSHLPSLLADQPFSENIGPTSNSLTVTQEIKFTYQASLIPNANDRFEFSQDDVDLPDADSSLFIDDASTLGMKVFSYFFDFSVPLIFTPGQASADLVGATLNILGESFQIVAAVEASSGMLQSLTLSNGVDIYVLTQGGDVVKNGVPIPSEVMFSLAPGRVHSLEIAVFHPAFEYYMTSGDVYVDPLFGKFEIHFNGINGGTFVPLEYLVGSTSGEIRFKNPDGRQVVIPLAADQSYQAGEAADEPVFLGEDAPSSTNANVDELLYLRGESCVGTVSITDCVGAQFLVRDINSNVHVLRITNINPLTNEIDFSDLTYGTVAIGVPYTDGGIITTFTVLGLTFNLRLREAQKEVLFVSNIVGQGDTLYLKNGDSLYVVNTDITTQVYDPWWYSDPSPALGLGPPNAPIKVLYDDAAVNGMVISLDATNAFTQTNGMGWYDESITNDDFIEFVTFYGTHATFDREDGQSFVLDVPQYRVFALVDLLTTP